MLVPATGVAEALRSGAAAGARSATVFSSGFGEAYDTEAAGLGRELAAVIAETGLAVSGPNCMGNVCAKTRFVTFPEDRMLTVKEGPVAMVGQSGGMMLFANGALNERGVVAEYLITSGNEAGLSVGDYIAFFADQPELKVIVIYVEAVSNLETFKAACRMARDAGKHIVALKLGQSEGGREAALAHTGSLAGSIEAFDAVAGEAGVVRADTLDDVVEMTELLAYTGAPSGRNLGAITLSGAFRGLLLDGAERNSLHFRPLEAATTEKLNAILGVGSLVGNPTDGGYGVLTSADNYINSIDAMQADPNVDIVLVQEQIPREAGSGRAEAYVRLLEDYAATRAKKPIAFCAPTSHGHTDFSRALRAEAPHVSFLQEANKALRAIAAVARRDEMERLARGAEGAKPAPTVEQSALVERLRKRAGSEAAALNEFESKEVLRAYGIATPKEELVASLDDALAAAGRIGYPVVLKAVSQTLTHKSDAGAVALNLATPEQLRAAYERMSANARGRHARRHAGRAVRQRRARAGARPASRPRDGADRHGRRRRRAARTDEGRRVLRAAGEPREGARPARAHPGRAADPRLSRQRAARRRGGGRCADRPGPARRRSRRRHRVRRHQSVRGAAAGRPGARCADRAAAPLAIRLEVAGLEPPWPISRCRRR